VAQNLAVKETVIESSGFQTVRESFDQPLALSRGWTDGWSRSTAVLLHRRALASIIPGRENLSF
jgi:hypothetical protein